MLAALLYLQGCSFKNRLRARLKRLKQPKYLIAALVGGGYFFFFFCRPMLLQSRGRMAGVPGLSSDVMMSESLGALILSVVVLLGWLLPNKRAALVFTEAEVAFLFPAPLNRQGLIHYKLIRSQSAILFTTLFFTLVSGRWRNASMVWSAILGWWIILSTFNLHSIGASFFRSQLLDRGITNQQRRIGVLALFAIAAAVVFVWARQTLPPLRPADVKDFVVLKGYLSRLLVSGPLPYLLYPFRLVVRPYLARNALAFLSATWPALLLMAAHYWWVIRSNVAFEEASVEASQKLADRVAAVRAGRMRGGVTPKKAKRPPFKLSPTGPPALALLWKNLIATGQFFTARIWLLVLWITIVVTLILTNTSGRSPGLMVIGGVCLGLLGMSVMMGPQIMRQDLRMDLAAVDILKQYPLRGWQIVLGEMLAPVAILTAAQWLLILLCVQFFNPPDHPIPLSTRLAFGAGAAVLAPALDLLALLIPNAAALLFPAWVTPGRQVPRGIETMGQGLIVMVGQVFALTIALLPAAAGFAVVFFLMKFLLNWIAGVPIGAVVAAIVLIAESGVGIVLLGRFFERLDVSAEMNP